MAALLLAAGQQGRRHAAPHCRVMVHQPRATLPGKRQAHEVGIQQRQLERSRLVLRGLLAKYSGQSLEQIEALLATDHHMSAEEALELGLVDCVGGLLAPAAGPPALAFATAEEEC